MSDAQVIHEGRAAAAAGIVTGVIALCGFGAVAAALLFLPDSRGWFHWGVGGALAFLALISIPWQLADARCRRHMLTEASLRYRSGVVGRFEIEIPYSGMTALTVRQGVFQRLVGCADVRISAPGVASPTLVTSRDLNSVVLRSIPDHEEVAELIRARMRT